ncbi:MAG: Cache 3/Cache 2 fusion domain-containing protein [Bdellovibrionales bacterium]|nr:Cache 3/Cache 2 fusion domain-containing protein [Bdellovibrionales bacterium]
MKNKIGLKKQLVFGFTLIALLVTSLSGLISFYVSSNIVTTATMSDLSHLLSGTESAIQISNQENIERQKVLMDYWLPHVKKNLDLTSEEKHSVTITNQVTSTSKTAVVSRWFYMGKDLESHQELASQISQETGSAISFMMLLPEGLLRVATSVTRPDGSRTSGTYIPADSEVYKSIAANKMYTGRAKVVGSWYVTTYEPLVKDGKVVGAFFIGTPDTASSKVKDYLHAQKLLETGYFYILDSKGNFVLHPTKTGENMLDKTDLEGRYIFREILEKKNGSIEYEWLNAETGRAQKKLAVFRYYPELDWVVAASVNKAEVEAPVTRLAWFLLLLTIVSVLTMLLCSWIFGHKIVSKLHSISLGLSESAKEVQGSLLQLSSAGNSLSQSASSAAASLEETVASLEEVSSMVETNAQNAKNAANLSAEASSLAHKGEGEIKELYASIQEMAKSSKRIQNINDVIDDIAFQTNLLALNAAVEAARAGEQGKGFAVVADAVRSLAQRSANSAKEISELIHQITTQMTQGTQIADRSSDSLKQIVEAVQKVSQINNEIASASDEQATGIQEINKAMNQLDGSSQENAAAAEEIAATSEDIKIQNHKVESNVRDLESYMLGSKNNAA